jgi:hypothetical protein
MMKYLTRLHLVLRHPTLRAQTMMINHLPPSWNAEDLYVFTILQ